MWVSFLLWPKEMDELLIIRIKAVVDIKTQEKVRERIKKQIAEGLIVHDDTVEITIADDMCTECGSNDLEEVMLGDGGGRINEHVLICERCGYQRNLMK